MSEGEADRSCALERQQLSSALARRLLSDYSPNAKRGDTGERRSNEVFVSQSTHILDIRSTRRGLLEITNPIRSWTYAHSLVTGLLTVFCRHTSASLLIQENAAPEVRTDLEAFFELIAPEDPGRYAHNDEGADDMPAHLRTALTQVQLSIPLIEGRLALGTWQGIYLFEHRRGQHDRQVALHLFGE